MFGFAFPVHFLILQASPNLWKTKWYLFLLKTCARLTNTFCGSVKCVDNILAPPSVWLKPTTGIGAKFCLTEQHSESKMKCVSYKMCSIWTITTNAKCVETQTETQIGIRSTFFSLYGENAEYPAVDEVCGNRCCGFIRFDGDLDTMNISTTELVGKKKPVDGNALCCG